MEKTLVKYMIGEILLENHEIDFVCPFLFKKSPFIIINFVLNNSL